MCQITRHDDGGQYSDIMSAINVDKQVAGTLTASYYKGLNGEGRDAVIDIETQME